MRPTRSATPELRPAVRIHADVARADLSSPRRKTRCAFSPISNEEISRSAPAIAITTVGTGRFHPDRSSSSCLSPSTKSGDESAATHTHRDGARREPAKRIEPPIAGSPPGRWSRASGSSDVLPSVSRFTADDSLRCSESRRICFWCAISASRTASRFSWMDLRRSFRRTGDGGTPKRPAESSAVVLRDAGRILLCVRVGR